MQGTTNTTHTLDTGSLENPFKVVTHTFIQIYQAQTEREKSQALRDHAGALLQYIAILDAVVPDGMQVPVTSTIPQQSKPIHSTL